MLKYFITYRCISCGNKVNVQVDKQDQNEPPQLFMRRTLKDTMYGTVPVMSCAVCCQHGYTKHEAIAIKADGHQDDLRNIYPLKPAL